MFFPDGGPDSIFSKPVSQSVSQPAIQTRRVVRAAVGIELEDDRESTHTYKKERERENEMPSGRMEFTIHILCVEKVSPSACLRAI